MLGVRLPALSVLPGPSEYYVSNVTLTMYDETMKTITITVPEELDERAAAAARSRGISKSELIREGLDAVLPPSSGTADADPWHSLAGFGAPDVRVEPGEVDDVIYSR